MKCWQGHDPPAVLHTNTPFLNTKALCVCVCKAYVPRGFHFISPAQSHRHPPSPMSATFTFFQFFVFFLSNCIYFDCPGSSLVAVPGLLVALASLVVQHRL